MRTNYYSHKEAIGILQLLSVKKNVEKVYGFTQKMEKQAFKPLPKNQETIMDYLRP